MGAVLEAIRDKLTAAFAPSRLDVVDESDRHAGHAGAAPGGQTHFDLSIESKAFSGLSRIERQRRIYAVLAEEFARGLHALSIKATAPGEG